MARSRPVHWFLLLATGRQCAACRAPAMEAVCAACRAVVRSTPAAAGAAYLDSGPVSVLVRRAKRGDWRRGGAVLAELAVAERRDAIPACDVVTWVPADPSRRARRGGHLPERLARRLAAQLGVPCVELLGARRRRPQRGLGRAARRANVAGAFAVRAARLDGLPAGARVLVVDDVRTTGATLAAVRHAFANLPVSVETFALVGVETAVQGRSRCQEARSERENSAQDSNHSCRW